MQIPEIVTYHSTNNKPEWFSYLKPNGEFLGVRFEGASEAEAIERAKNWWINEKSRQNRLTGRVELDDDEVDSKPYKSDDGWGNFQSKTFSKSSRPDGNWNYSKLDDAPVGSTHGMSGKVWLGNPTTKEKKRVDPSEVASLMNEGWIKCGPRTQI